MADTAPAKLPDSAAGPSASAAASTPKTPRRNRSLGLGLGLSFRVLLTVGIILAAVLPLATFGGVLLFASLDKDEAVVAPLLIATIVGAALFGLLAASLVIASLTAPLRRITLAVERVAAGESSPPIFLTGDDELARLAESHNRIAADSQRRNASLGALLRFIAEYSPALGVDALRGQAQTDACLIFGLIDCRMRLLDPASVETEEMIPGDPRPVRATVRAGSENLGLLSGHLPATRGWEHADQDLLDLFASEVGVALRNAELFGRIEDQNVRLLELDAAKDEFLRGVSHNLQTPLTSIRAYVDQMRAASPEPETDRRLAIVAEQSGRLTRLVHQLLTVTRLEAGVLRPEPEVIALAPRIRRTWEALGATAVTFDLRDQANGWLAVADPDQLDQVLWALLDNAVKYGGPEGRVTVTVSAVRADSSGGGEGGAGGGRGGGDACGGRLEVTIADAGPGIPEADRARLFTRFTRGAAQTGGDGTGLGLYLSRQLLRGMSGELRLAPGAGAAGAPGAGAAGAPGAGVGAAFTLSLPGEPPGDGR